MVDAKNAWLLAIAYACSFGVEITFNNAGSLYFQDEFNLDTQSAAFASCGFGLANLFARAAGGILSDKMNQRLGMQGRLLLSTVTIMLQGCASIAFAYCDTLGSAVPVMLLFACLVHATEGAIFGIVPYIKIGAYAGSIAGIVGMGGNIGGLVFAVCFQQFSYQTSFVIMGVAAMLSSFVHVLIYIPGHSRLFMRKHVITEAEPPAGLEEQPVSASIHETCQTQTENV